MAANPIPADHPSIAVQDPPRLSPNQRRAVLALLEHPTLADAADIVGVSKRTLNRWLQLPHFRACLDRLEDARELALACQFHHGAGTAFEVLTGIATDKRKEPAARVQASRHLLEYADRRHARRNSRDL